MLKKWSASWSQDFTSTNLSHHNFSVSKLLSSRRNRAGGDWGVFSYSLHEHKVLCCWVPCFSQGCVIIIAGRLWWIWWATTAIRSYGLIKLNYSLHWEIAWKQTHQVWWASRAGKRTHKRLVMSRGSLALASSFAFSSDFTRLPSNGELTHSLSQKKLKNIDCCWEDTGI